MALSRASHLVLLSLFLIASASGQSREELRTKAKETSAKIAEIVAKGPDASEEQMRLLQELVNELKQLNANLKAIPAEAPKPKVTVNGYLQVQYQSTDRSNLPAIGPYDAFRIRRARVNLDADPKERLRLRVSFDTTGGPSQTELRLREAYARYTAPGKGGLMATAGQQALPFGYEIERSSFDHDFAERTILSTTYFNGEFTPGIRLDKDLGRGWRATLGGFDSLTVQDPEQQDRNFGAGDDLALAGAITNEGRTGRIRLSGLAGHRPAFTIGNAEAPTTERQFVALDGAWRRGPLTVRGEAVSGRDRRPNTNSVDRPVFGWHAQASYDLDAHNSVAVRYQKLDRDRDTPGDTVYGYAVSYTWRFDRELKLVLSHEVLHDELREALGNQRYSETVLRLAVRF